MTEENTVKRGVFITIEGIDGAGKTTQARMLEQRLRERGHAVVLTREPGGTALGERLRSLLLDEGQVQVDAQTELLLYAADRAQHVAEVIRPALAEGRTVVCERYADSTAAYQGYGRSLGMGVVRELNRIATGGLQPDLTLLLDLPPEHARERLAETPDRLERENPGFHRRVAEGYRELARTHPERIKVIDANRAPEQVFKHVARAMETFLREPARSDTRAA